MDITIFSTAHAAIKELEGFIAFLATICFAPAET